MARYIMLDFIRNVFRFFKANLESAAATAAESQQRLAQQPDPSALYPELEQLRQYKVY